MIEPKYSEVFTFSVYCDDGAKLYVNDLLILDHWYSRISEVDGTIALMADTKYPIRLEYKQVSGNASVQMRWSSKTQMKEIVPSSSLFTWTTTSTLSNSDQPLYVEPAKVCSTQSSAFGQGLSLATAGQTAYFTLQSRDEYENNRKVADSGVRPGNPGTARLVNFGTMEYISASVVKLDNSSSGVGQAYKNYILYIDSTNEWRQIINYTTSRIATLDSPLSTTMNTQYKVLDLISLDLTGRAAFDNGYPEFHIRVLPVVDGGEEVLHSIPDRLASLQYAGGLTATYYDGWSSSPSVDADRLLSGDTFSTPRWSTWCSAGQPCDYTIDFSKSSNFKKYVYGDGCGVKWTNKVLEGTTVSDGDAHAAYLNPQTASAGKNAYLDHYILFLDGLCERRWTKIVSYEQNSFVAGLNVSDNDLWSDGLRSCIHGNNSAYEIYQDAIDESQRSQPLFPRMCEGGSDLTRGWMAFEPNENYRASLIHSDYAVRWSGYLSPTVAGVYTFYADLPSASATGESDDRVKLWIDNEVVIMQWTSLSSVNGARSGTFMLNSYPSIHTISVHYKNNVADSGLQLRWQTQEAGHKSAFTQGISGKLPADTVCSSPYYTRLGSVSAGDGFASSTVDGLYNKYYIKFETSGACNNRWTQVSNDNAVSASEVYDKSTSCIYVGETWSDGGVNCSFASGDQFKLVEWLSLPGIVTSSCSPDAHDGFTYLIADVELAATLVSLTPSEVTRLNIVVPNIIRIDDEYMLVTAVSSGTLTVTRAVSWSVLARHREGVKVYTLANFGLTTKIPLPATTFQDMVVLFTTGSCKGRYGKIVKWNNDTSCAAIGGSFLDQGNNWLDGGATCSVMVGDSYLVKFGINSSTVTNATGTAGSLPISEWLSSVGTLQADDDYCKNDYNHVHLSTLASARDLEYENHYIRFTSGICNGEWAKISYYDGGNRCAKLEWESLGKSGVFSVSNAVASGKSINQLDAIISFSDNVITMLNLAAGVYIQVDFEIMLIVDIIDSNRAFVSRAQGNTGALPHAELTAVSVVGMRCSYGDTYTLGITAGGPIVPSSRMFPLSGRYMVEYTPIIRGDYQVHASLAQGSGLDATFYDDQELNDVAMWRVDPVLNFSISDRDIGYDNANWANLLSDRLSFSVRWAGLLQLDDDVVDQDNQIFTFEASIAEFDERVKLWVDNSLIIDRWDTYDHLSSTVFSATIGLKRPNYYDVKMEYKQFAGSEAKAVLKWQCQIPGSSCQNKEIIPSSNLFRIREVMDSPFPPFSVMPAPTSADRCIADGAGLSSATAGIPALFNIQANDEYDNERGVGGDLFIINAVPFDTWDQMEKYEQSRASADCTECPHTIHGLVTDLGDSSYLANFTGTKRGAYKVLTSYAMSGGLFATYYTGTPTSYYSSFHRYNQTADSQADFASACVYQKWKVGFPLSSFECASPGYDRSDTGHLELGFLRDGSNTTHLLLDSSTRPSSYVGMTIAIVSGKAALTVRTIIDELSDKTVVVAALSEDPDSSSQYKIVGSKWQRNSGWIKGQSPVGIDRNSIKLPANGSWDRLDEEPYSATIVSPNDGVGSIQEYTDLNVHGGINCSQENQFRLGPETSGVDDDYNNRYIKFTSGTCKGRWNKIQSYVGPGMRLIQLGQELPDPTTVMLPASINKAENYYNFSTICVTSGTSAGECRKVVSYNGTVATVSPGFSTALNANSVIQIIGGSKCATLASTWSDGGAACVPSAGDNYKLMGDWRIVFTKGTCKGQFSLIADYEVSTDYAAGGTIHLATALSDSSQTGVPGPYGEVADDYMLSTITYNFTGCTAPDYTSEYVLVPGLKPPGSIDSLTGSFQVRWSGFIQPTSNTAYTFFAQLPDAAGNQERVKLWLDNVLVIDQWSSLNGNLPSGTILFANSQTSLYDLQFEYKRDSISDKPPRVKLTWLNTLSGLEANGENPIMASRLFTKLPVPNDATLDLVATGTDPQHCMATGSGLTTATAGQQALFSITSRDAYANLRDLDEDSYIVYLKGPNTTIFSKPSAVVASPGVYGVEFTPTQSGDYTVNVERPQAGGLAASWYNNMWMMGDPADTSISSDINYNWSTSFVTPRSNDQTKTGSDYVSIRWTGYFKPELSETYTFSSSYDDGFALYIDDEKLIDDWEGVNKESWCTMNLEANRLYEMTVEYRDAQEQAYCRLYYSSSSVMKSIIPSSRLYHSAEHIFGSPFKLYVNPAVTCGPVSLMSGLGLSYATAGLTAAFTIQARDEYSNLKTKWGDTFVVGAAATNAIAPDARGNFSTMPYSARDKHGTVGADVMKGRYGVQYEVTAASSITLYSAFVVTGGVFATYYNDVSATYYNHPYAALTSETIGKIQVDTDVTIRYSGLFRAESTFIYTFQPYQTTDYNDRVRLWIDSELIIDQWSSLASSIPSGTFSFPVENEYYQIQVLYRQSAANRPDELQFVYNSSNGVPFSQISSSRLFTASHVQGSPFTITVNPALTDFDTSILFGEGLSIATAGVTASFSIQVKDTFNNLRLEGGDNFTAQLSKSLSPIVLSASIVDNTDGTYQVSYLPKIEGQYNLGIYLGTYQKTSSVYVEPGVICAAMSVVNGLSLTIGTAGFTASFTIQAKDSFDNLRTLGVDNFIVRLDGPDTEEHNVLARYLGSSPNTNLGRFTVAYRTTKSGNFGMSIFAAADNGLNTTYYRDPELNFAVYNEIVPNVDFDVGDSTPNEYVGIVDGFSIQWQGFVKPQFSETYTFTGIVAEKDERIKVWLDDQWIIDQWSSLDTLTPSGSLWLVGELLYDFKVQYKEISGQSSAAIMWQSPSMSQAIVPSSRLFASANHLAGSPFATSVFPARTSGVLSIATGQGLSLATAGVPASFTIQAKDHLGNVKTTSDDVFVVRARFNGIHDDINKKNRIGIVTNIGPGLYSASYTATWKRNALSDNGWQIDTYSASKLGQYQDIGFSGIRKKFHDVLVSQALPGGLMATYYGMINSDFGSGPWEDYMKEPWLEPVSSKISPVVDVVGSPNAVESFCVSDAANFGVRFAGFFSPATAQRYTFRTIIGNTQTERVRLWVDNFLVINQWMSLSDPVDTSTGFAVYEGTFQFDSLNDFHDIRIDYKHVNTTSYDSTKVSLEYIFAAQVLDDCPSTVGSDACLQCVGRSCQYNGTAVLIPSARLFQSHDLNFDIFEAGGLTATYYDSYETVGALLDGGVYDVLVTGSAIYPYDTTCAATCQTPCTGSGFSCECNVTSGNVTMITIIDQGSGYSAQYPPIISCGGGTGQSFYPRISFAGGIVGGNLVPRKAVQEPVVDWSGSSFTDRPYPSSVADGRFSVRWMGFVRPSRMDEYTFYVSLPSLDPSNNNAHSSERVRLWVDNSLIVNQWVSLGAGPAYSGTATFPKPNEYYSIQVDYKITDTQNLRGITLEYENLASRLPLLYGKPAVNSTDVVTRGVIRSDRLFSTRVSSEVQRDDYQIWDTDYYDSSKIWNVDWKVPRTSQWSKTNGCPTTPGSLRYDECRGQGTRTNEILRVDVKPAEISADNCNVLGDSLTIATAGVTRTFTLTARDAYDNQRDANDDAFIARATLVDSTSQAFHGTFVHQDWETLYSLGELNNPVWDQNGKYEVTYVVTRSGTFQNVIQELDTGGRGLWGTYFVGSLLEQGKLMGSQAESTIDFAWGSNNPLNASAPYQGCWSARWVGFLNGNYSEIFTFTVVTDGGVRLKFDDMTIIDQWNSTSANEFSATVQMVQGVFYDLEVEYVTGAIGDKMLQLYWQSNSQAKDIVSNSNLRVESNVLGLPSNSGGPNGGYNTLFVHPTVVCATTSAVAGAGLTIATAGVRASFSVWSKDMYGNLRDDTNDILVARMFPDDSDTESGVTFAGTGLQATYYDALGFALPLHATATGATIGNWVASTQGYFSFSASTDPFTTSDNGWSVRWEGTIRPSYSELYAFTVNMSSTDRVKLWIDQSLIIDQWSSLSSTAPVGPYQSDGLVHSIKIDYRKLSTSPYVFALLWNATSVPQEEVSPVALYPCKYPSSLDAHGTACQVDSKIQTDTNLAQNLSYGVTTFSNFGFYRLQPVPNSSTATAFGPFSGNRRPFGYVQTRAGSHTVAIDEVGYNFDYRDGTFRSVPGLGLMATFYDTPGFGTARNSFDCGMGQSGCLTTNIDWSTAGLDGPFSLASDGSFSARWTGMVRIDQNVSDGVFALDLNANGKEERVKLWIDNSLLIDQWVSLSATSLDTRKNFYLPGEMYSIKVEYKKVLASSGTGAFLRLKWNNETVSRDNLYPAHVVSGMYKRVRVNPAVAFAPSCEVHGVGLTLATAGQEASFLIQSKDAYNNIRGIGGDLFVVRAFSDGCQSLNPGRDTLCNGYTGSRSPSSSTYAMNAACSDAAECAPYPPQVGSNGPNLLGDLVPGGSYIDEIVGISVLPDSTGRVLPVGSSTTQIMLRPGHFATADVYVGAALTISGCDAAKSDGLTITAYDANRIATLSEALPAVPDSTCVYTINATKTVAFLDSAASAVDDAYTDYNIMFTSGPCIDRWTRIVGYAGGQYDVAKVAYLEASIAPWIQGSVQTVVSASLLILNTMSPSDNDWRGMWLTINDASGNQQHHCKIIASSGYNITLGTSIPSTISSEDLVSFIIHGWEDGGRPCDASSGHVKLIPRICNTVIDQGTVQAVGYSVIAATIADQGSGYFAGDLVVNCSGGCIGWNLTGYCVNASDGVGLEIVITDGGRSYSPSSPPEVSCPSNSPTTAMVVTLSLAVREIQLASSASITAGAYVGYSVSVDGSGEKRTIEMYYGNRTAVISQSFTDSPLASRNLYTVSGCLGSQGPLYCPQCPRIIRADVVDNGDSTYSAVFTGTRKGQYTVVTSLVSAGGLTSTYYNDLDNTVSMDFGEGNPQSSRVDNILDWSSADGSLPTSLSGSKFGVRWVGFVRPSQAQQYTFSMNLFSIGKEERVKLWVDNSIIIQQWTSLASTSPSGTIGFGKGNGYYDIMALYKCTGNCSTAGYALKWLYQTSSTSSSTFSTIPSDRLFQRLDVPNAASGLRIQPAVTCASESVAFAQGLTLATAGVGSSFTIRSKDAYENVREDTSASFTVSLHGSGGTPVYAGAVIANAPSTLATYTGSFTLQNAKGYEVFVKHGNDNVKGSPFTLTVKPATTCGTTSTIRGTGLTMSSISPTKSAFTIQARDQFGNAKTTGPNQQEFIVRVVRTSGINKQGTNGLPPMYDSTAINVQGTLHAEYNTPTLDGSLSGYYQVPPTPDPANLIHYLYASWTAVGGVTATYYTYADAQSGEGGTWGSPLDMLVSGAAANKRMGKIGTNADNTSSVDASSVGLWGGEGLQATQSAFAIRWNGMYKNTNQTTYFKWDSGLPSDRVRLWIDNVLIIDQWSSLDQNSTNASYVFDSIGELYDIQLDWKRAADSPATFVNLQDSEDEVTYSDIPSSRLYVQEFISGSPYYVSVSC
uniref:PA14 domain-containing protein n=1 Tax=Hanusia phi TaxID=3032 RepID=A0A7S0EWB6_9CRYP